MPPISCLNRAINPGFGNWMPEQDECSSCRESSVCCAHTLKLRPKRTEGTVAKKKETRTRKVKADSCPFSYDVHRSAWEWLLSQIKGKRSRFSVYTIMDKEFSVFDGDEDDQHKIAIFNTLIGLDSCDGSDPEKITLYAPAFSAKQSVTKTQIFVDPKLLRDAIKSVK